MGETQQIKTLYTSVEGAEVFTVKKNEQNFEQAAGQAIRDGMQKSKEYKLMEKANEILNYVKMKIVYIVSGKFEEAREVSKQLAELGLKNFEIYKAMTNFKITGMPQEVYEIINSRTQKYEKYIASLPKTAEELQLEEMNKKYLEDMKAQNKKTEPIEIKYPPAWL